MSPAFPSKCRGKGSLKTSDKKANQTLANYQGRPGNLPVTCHTVMAPTQRMRSKQISGAPGSTVPAFLAAEWLLPGAPSAGPAASSGDTCPLVSLDRSAPARSGPISETRATPGGHL